MGGRGVKRVPIRDGLQGWCRLRSRSQGKRGRTVATETVGGIGTIGMVEEMVVVGIGEAIDLVVEGVGLVVEGSTVGEEEGIGIDRLSFQGLFSFFPFWSIGRFFASTDIEGGRGWCWQLLRYFGQDFLRENEPLVESIDGMYWQGPNVSVTT